MARVTSEELIQMHVKLGTGVSFEDSGFPQTKLYRDAWEDCKREAEEIEKKGGVVELPMDLPD